jgi:hypothetical protein
VSARCERQTAPRWERTTERALAVGDKAVHRGAHRKSRIRFALAVAVGVHLLSAATGGDDQEALSVRVEDHTHVVEAVDLPVLRQSELGPVRIGRIDARPEEARPGLRREHERVLAGRVRLAVLGVEIEPVVGTDNDVAAADGDLRIGRRAAGQGGYRRASGGHEPARGRRRRLDGARTGKVDAVIGAATEGVHATRRASGSSPAISPNSGLSVPGRLGPTTSERLTTALLTRPPKRASRGAPIPGGVALLASGVRDVPAAAATTSDKTIEADVRIPVIRATLDVLGDRFLRAFSRGRSARRSRRPFRSRSPR